MATISASLALTQYCWPIKISRWPSTAYASLPLASWSLERKRRGVGRLDQNVCHSTLKDEILFLLAHCCTFPPEPYPLLGTVWVSTSYIHNLPLLEDIFAFDCASSLCVLIQRWHFGFSDPWSLLAHQQEVSGGRSFPPSKEISEISIVVTLFSYLYVRLLKFLRLLSVFSLLFSIFSPFHLMLKISSLTNPDGFHSAA